MQPTADENRSSRGNPTEKSNDLDSISMDETKRSGESTFWSTFLKLTGLAWERRMEFYLDWFLENGGIVRLFRDYLRAVKRSSFCSAITNPAVTRPPSYLHSNCSPNEQLLLPCWSMRVCCVVVVGLLLSTWAQYWNHAEGTDTTIQD